MIRPLIDEMLSEHNAYIDVENSEHHAANKKRYLTRFFGSAALRPPRR
ncbi:MAG: hypothetical protein M3Z22_03960 [Verrucomicrobiota bacterium]|nr:hypothetical protein [Verrucomicrobiota bacterium]